MSVSKWDYKPKKCDGDYCCGDCDLCDKENDDDTDDRPEGQERSGA